MFFDIARSVALFFLVSQTNKQPGVGINSNVTPAKMKDTAEPNEIGLSMAGGLFRASLSCYGVLRGFQQKRVKSSSGKDVSAMDLVKYNSGISGGAVPSVLYSYAGVPVEELLEMDRTTDPSKITAEELTRMPKTSMGYVLSKKPDQNQIILRSALKLLLNPFNIFGIHSAWTALVRKKVCEPLKMPKNKYFTSSRDELEIILNEDPKLKAPDFLLPRDDIKALPMILLSSFGARFDRNEYETNFVKILDNAWEEYDAKEKLGKKPNMNEILLSVRDQYGSNLPMPYVVTPDCVENKYNGEVQIKNKKVRFPEEDARPSEWGSKGGIYGRGKRFSAEFLIGLSSNFIGIAKYEGYSRLQAMASALRSVNLSDGSRSTVRLADGGMNDMFGIIPLVDRGTKNVISIYNFNQNLPMCRYDTTYADIYKAAPCTSMEDPDLEKHFEIWIQHISVMFTCFFGKFGHGQADNAMIMNHIFYDPNLDRLKELMVKYNSLFELGEPLIATLKDLEVMDNPFWGVKGGKTVNLTLMWFNLPEKFSSQISKDVADFESEEYQHIPQLPVENAVADTWSITHQQANMMGYLGSWMVDRSWDGLKGPDGEVLFEGFATIFGQE